ncbi:hypothetical protein QJS10_CPB15g01421 [Acorus calamus]|uniref:GP-PDE domain-containing protein n=1 Tax=Acorus calamus TaxID=4465 RepID=A0AAV9D877_ACOCL|nr:hypothetical protein QJS10_CPB15g01421 [Acorus calamus]
MRILTTSRNTSLGLDREKTRWCPPRTHLTTPTGLIAKAHSRDLQVHPYVDGLFTDFTGSLHRFQEWTDSSRSS